MAGRVLFRCLLGVLGIGLCAGWVMAADGNTADSKLARLESLLEAQQQEIAMLERQVSAAQQSDMDGQRAEMMRQQIREVLSEQEFRESLMPTMLQAGYDDGFFIRSSDDRFLMKINGGVQFRFTHYGTRAQNRWLLPRLQRNDRTGFDVQRIRLALSGHAYTEDLTYMMEIQADAPDGYNFVASEVWVNYRFMDEFQFRAGLLRLPSTRSQSYYEMHQQMIDRSMTDAVFGFGFGIGAQFWGQLFDKRLEYRLAVVNGVSSGEGVSAGRTITTDPAENDNNPAIMFRMVWHALGDDPEGDFTHAYDYPRHENPALDIGMHYVFNEDDGDLFTSRVPYPRATLIREGGYGLTTTNGLQVHQFGLDMGFKWQGFSATGEYILRTLDVRRARRVPFTPWWLLTGDDSTVAQHGAYLQMGYFLPIPGMEDKLEAVARVGGISALADEQEGTWEWTVGMNYYIEGDKVKLQADFTKIYEAPISSGYSSLANVNDDALIFRVQLQFLF